MTKNDEIIIFRPIQKNIQIKISNIEKIEKRSPSIIVIYFHDENNNLKKQQIWTRRLKGKDQITFNEFIESIKNRIFPAD
jgi:hypothetical protein